MRQTDEKWQENSSLLKAASKFLCERFKTEIWARQRTFQFYTHLLNFIARTLLNEQQNPSIDFVMKNSFSHGIT